MMELPILGLEMEDRFPVVQIPMEKLEFRWHELGPESKKFVYYLEVYGEVIKGIREDYVPQMRTGYFSRYDAIKTMIRSFDKYGMVNPLIVNEYVPGIFFVLVGNQRYCALLAQNYEGDVPCRVSPIFDHVEILKFHPLKIVPNA